MLFTQKDFEICCEGAVEIRQDENAFVFERFTPQQMDVYSREAPELFSKTYATSGIKLCFTTNARAIHLDFIASPGSSRTFCYFDCYVNHEMLYHSGIDDITKQNQSSEHWPLPNGNNFVEIYFPNLTKVAISSLKLEEGNLLNTTHPNQKLLAFGDSITQGYDARYPSLSYAAQLAKFSGMQLFNKAIGGDYFRPNLVLCKDAFTPQLITIAYGTNDWSRSKQSTFTHDSAAFLQNIANTFPGIKTLLFLPIWRADCDKITDVGTFNEMKYYLRTTAEKYPQIQVIQPSFPHQTNFFSDAYLHPNDLGFQMMAQSIVQEAHLK